MTHQAEARNIGGADNTGLDHDFGGGTVELGHGAADGLAPGGQGLADLGGKGDDSRTERLGQDEDVAGAGLVVGDEPRGVDQAGDGEAELDLLVLDAVAAEQNRAGFGQGVDAALHHLVQDAVREAVDGEGDDGQGGQRAAAHGIDVGDGVGGGDAAEEIGVVDDWGEDVDGLD